MENAGLTNEEICQYLPGRRRYGEPVHYITILKWQEDNGDTTWGAMCESLSYYITAESRSRLVGLIDEWLAWPENAQKRVEYRS